MDHWMTAEGEAIDYYSKCEELSAMQAFHVLNRITAILYTAYL